MLIIKSICEEKPCIIQLERAFGVLLVTHGQGGMYINNDWAELHPGRVFFLNDAGVLTLEGNLLIGHLIEFPEVMLQGFLSHFETHKERGLYQLEEVFNYEDLEPGDQQFFLNMMGRLTDELERHTSAFIFKYMLFVLLRHINRKVEGRSVMTRYQERIFTELMDLIARYYTKSRKTRFYAEKLGLSNDQLLAFSEEVFEKKFFDVLMERILTEADLMLINTKMSIQQIAYKLGFSTPSQFDKYYSRHKGSTPTEFRKKWGNSC